MQTARLHENDRHRWQTPVAQSADKAHNRKNRSDILKIRSDSCFMRQLHLHPWLAGFLNALPVCPLCQHPAPLVANTGGSFFQPWMSHPMLCVNLPKGVKQKQHNEELPCPKAFCAPSPSFLSAPKLQSTQHTSPSPSAPPLLCRCGRSLRFVWGTFS